MGRTTTSWLTSLLLLLVVSAAHADFSKLDPRARIAVSQMQSGATAQQARLQGAAVSESGQIDAFIRGSVSRAELEALGVEVHTALPGLYTAYIPVDMIDQVAALASVTSIRGSAPVEPNLNQSVPATGATVLRGTGPAFTGINGAGVLVGDIDTGIDFDHGDFKDAGGFTRLVNIWDQTVNGVFPAGYTYGTEWSAAQIDAALCTETDPASGGGHGSHCLGIVGGDGSQTGGAIPAYTYVGMAPKADLIMVKTDLTDTHIVDGVAYFFGRATARGQNASLNVSLGSQFGPHDGSSDFETAFSSIVGPGKIICVSAGNDRSTNIHAKLFAVGAGDSAKLAVTGGTVNGRLLAIDGYYNGTENLNVTIRSPGNKFIGPITLGNLNAAYPGAATGVNGTVYVENGVATTATGAREVYIEILATGTGTGATTGTWTFYFTPVSLGASGGRVDMWRYYTSTTSLGATFSLKNTNDNLVSEPGNAKQVITVAAYVTKPSWIDCGGRSVSYSAAPVIGTLASFSSPGPSRDNGQKPDITAPGFGVASARSFDYTINCGTTASSLVNDGGNHIINQGTSMAAPHVTGACALLFQKFGALTPAQLKTYINTNAIIDANTGSPWNQDWGNGKLHLSDLQSPTVAVVSPNGGEVTLIGVNANLQWTASDNVGVTSCDLYLSRNGVGGPWETIALGVPNSGSYVWNVTGPTTNNAILRVDARDAANNVSTDNSDAVWAINDAVTGTLLSEFVALPTDAGIQLRWQFGDASQFTSVAVERADAATGPWRTIDADRSTDGNAFIALDRAVTAGATYWYRLNATRPGGSSTIFGPLSGSAGSALVDFALSKISPNPTKGAALVEFAVPKSANVKIVVLDVQGREVQTLVDGIHQPGRYQAMWSGEVNGHVAAPGLYFIRLMTPGHNIVRRVVLAR